MNWLLGVDGGGTKTDAVLADPGGAVRARVRVGGTSLTRFSPASVEGELRDARDRLLATSAPGRPDAIAAACAGFASASAPANYAVYMRILQALLPAARIEVTTDAEIAWQGAAAGADAIIVIAGTGSIAWGHFRGQRARAGGFGPPRDAGSGDWCGREAVARGFVQAPADGNYAALLPVLAPDPRCRPLWRAAGAALTALAAECAAVLGWPTAQALLIPVGGIFDHVPAVGAACLAAWPGRSQAPAAAPVLGALQRARALASASA